MSSPLVVSCPICAAPVEWTPASRWRPFCSQRCRTIDLGAWASEAYRIPLATSPDSERESGDPAASDDESHGSG
jgi:endogenous inhibitor of DNA gyrase (YacG/DUF329 family)